MGSKCFEYPQQYSVRFRGRGDEGKIEGKARRGQYGNRRERRRERARAKHGVKPVPVLLLLCTQQTEASGATTHLLDKSPTKNQNPINRKAGKAGERGVGIQKSAEKRQNKNMTFEKTKQAFYYDNLHHHCYGVYTFFTIFSRFFASVCSLISSHCSPKASGERQRVRESQLCCSDVEIKHQARSSLGTRRCSRCVDVCGTTGGPAKNKESNLQHGPAFGIIIPSYSSIQQRQGWSPICTP